MIKNYSREIGFDVQATLNPPKKLMVEVVVLEDHPDILDHKGNSIRIAKGSGLFLSVDLVEKLILKNVVEIMD